MNPTIIGSTVLSTLVTFVVNASNPPAALDQTAVTQETCDHGEVTDAMMMMNPVVATKTGGAVCQSVVGAANSVLGRDPSWDEYKQVVPSNSKEASGSAWTKTWKGWVYGSKDRRQALIHAAYLTPFGREATEAEIDYWTAKQGGYREILDGNMSWVRSAAGANERSRIIDQAYRQAAFERAPTGSEVTYWMEQYGKVDAPTACGGGKIDTFDKLRCANDEWFWSPASAGERSRVVREAGLLACFGPKGTFDAPGPKGTFEPVQDFVDAWTKRILLDRLSLTVLAQTENFTEKGAQFCKGTAKTLTPTKLVR